MGNAMMILSVVQVFFAVVIGMYFWNLLRTQTSNRSAIEKESKKELEKLRKLRSISLSEPLAEKTRPSTFAEIVGQEEGLKALRAALCGPNPQHVLIYGPPGVGKTAAARVVLDEAKKRETSPFAKEAKFIELDATTARFDERGIADPLIGSVHDPIYQGAGAMGMAGIPQPKQGAVTKAHGGVLFIDEIGELHPIQMNKLLKVLEDRKVFLESAYYSSEDGNIPSHIHDIFQNGLPADFRLIGATTRTPQEIPPAIRSRCMEIYFRALTPEEIALIVQNAADKIRFPIEPAAVDLVTRYATNGREAVNVVQLSTGLALTERRVLITQSDIEWVIHSSQISPRPEKKIPAFAQVGVVNGLAVYGPNMGMLLEIEVTATKTTGGNGTLQVTGIVEEEQLGGGGQVTRRKSTARGSVENVMTMLERVMKVPVREYDIHINYPGGGPVDGPSAGVAMATAIFSAIIGKPVDHQLAMTGEVSIRGLVKPVGGVIAKVEAAKQAGATRVFIPKDNWQDILGTIAGIEVVPVEHIQTVIEQAVQYESSEDRVHVSTPTGILSAASVQGTDFTMPQ